MEILKQNYTEAVRCGYIDYNQCDAVANWTEFAGMDLAPTGNYCVVYGAGLVSGEVPPNQFGPTGRFFSYLINSNLNNYDMHIILPLSYGNREPAYNWEQRHCPWRQAMKFYVFNRLGNVSFWGMNYAGNRFYFYLTVPRLNPTDASTVPPEITQSPYLVTAITLGSNSGEQEPWWYLTSHPSDSILPADLGTYTAP
jgi:hypothetical protein